MSATISTFYQVYETPSQISIPRLMAPPTRDIPNWPRNEMPDFCVQVTFVHRYDGEEEPELSDVLSLICYGTFAGRMAADMLSVSC